MRLTSAGGDHPQGAPGTCWQSLSLCGHFAASAPFSGVRPTLMGGRTQAQRVSDLNRIAATYLLDTAASQSSPRLSHSRRQIVTTLQLLQVGDQSGFVGRSGLRVRPLQRCWGAVAGGLSSLDMRPLHGLLPGQLLPQREAGERPESDEPPLWVPETNPATTGGTPRVEGVNRRGASGPPWRVATRSYHRELGVWGWWCGIRARPGVLNPASDERQEASL